MSAPVTSSPWLTRRGAAMLLVLGLTAFVCIAALLFFPVITPTVWVVRGVAAGVIGAQVVVAACLMFVVPNEGDHIAGRDEATRPAVRRASTSAPDRERTP